SLPWRSFLRYAIRRLGCTLATLLLDLRSSGGLHPDHSWLRVHVGDRSSLLAQTHFWLPNHGGRDNDDRDYQFRCVGTPHVRRGSDVGRQHVFCHLNDARRGSDRDQDLQLARHDVRRQDSAGSADVLLPRLPFPISDCGSDWSDAGRCSFQLAAHGFLLRRRSLSLRFDWRSPLRALRRLLLLVSEGFRQAAEPQTGALAFLAFHDRLPSDFRHDAFLRSARNAATHFHIRPRSRLGDAQPYRLGRRDLSGSRGSLSGYQHPALTEARPKSGQ